MKGKTDQIVYGSRFPASEDERVYLLANPTNRTAHGRISVPGELEEGFMWFDCYRGAPIDASIAKGLKIEVEGLGLGCVYAVRERVHAARPRPGLEAFFQEMVGMTAKKLAEFSGEWSFLQQKMVPSPKTTRKAAVPADMVKIPATGKIDIK